MVIVQDVSLGWYGSFLLPGVAVPSFIGRYASCFPLSSLAVIRWGNDPCFTCSIAVLFPNFSNIYFTFI